jgi:hypothetical protein
VLNLSGSKKWWQWIGEVKPRHALFLARALWRTQRMMDPQYYLNEHHLGPAASAAASRAALHAS